MLRRFSLLLTVALCSGCASFSPPDARPGLSTREIYALENCYYREPTFRIPNYSDGQLSQLLAGTSADTQGGERSEEHDSEIAAALASAGDIRFAKALSRQTKADQQAIAQSISPMWKNYGLRYPMTRHLLRRFQ